MTMRMLRCPACDGPMQQVDRRGVMIDICRDCRGVYLDRGELDKLLDEVARQEPAPLATEVDRLRGGRFDRDDDDDDDDYRGERRGERGRRRRRGGWLDDIFDFG